MQRRRRGLLADLGDELLGWLWFVPGVVALLVAIVVGGEEVLLVIGLVLLLAGGAAKFGDFIW